MTRQYICSKCGGNLFFGKRKHIVRNGKRLCARHFAEGLRKGDKVQVGTRVIGVASGNPKLDWNLIAARVR